MNKQVDNACNNWPLSDVCIDFNRLVNEPEWEYLNLEVNLLKDEHQIYKFSILNPNLMSASSRRD